MNTKPVTARGVARLILRLGLFLALLGLMTGSPPPAQATGPYTVNVSYDGPDSNLTDGICNDGIGGCTLRAAIEQASNDGASTTITFDSSLSGITFYLSNSYGSLIVSGSSIQINGYTGPGSYPPIIDGSSLTGATDIFEIEGSSITLTDLVIRDGPANGISIHDPVSSGYGSYNSLEGLIIYGNAQNGILVEGDSGGGGYDNTVANSLIGAANWAQTTCPGDGNGWEGIAIANDADNTNIISNEIVCNGNSGIWLNGSLGGQISGTQIRANLIGTDGSVDMGNGAAGIADTYASGTIIYNNVISGNSNDGIWLQGSDNAILTANRIGVDQVGSTALPNEYVGISITDGAYGNTIGSPTDANARNIISGNSLCGVDINSGANNNVLDGNYIGLGGADGMVVLPNGLAGVCLSNVSNNALSSSGASVIQYISGNTREGVYTVNSGTVIIGNATYIGVAGNNSTPAGNTLEGVKLDSGTTLAIIRPGKVVYNGGTGIAVVGNTSVGNQLTPLEVRSNAGLPIDLGNDGATDNGTQSPPGPNNWMNYPTISSASGLHITGSTCPGCYVWFYNATGDPRASAGGGVFFAFLSADGTTGNFEYTIPNYAPAITMVACDADYNCSEMSPNYVATTFTIYLPLVIR